MDASDKSVIAALRKSGKGKLKYDRYFEEEGRTKEIVDAISTQLSRLSISPKALALITEQNDSCSKTTDDVKKPVKNHLFTPVEKPKRNDDAYYLNHSSEKELPILEYESERAKYAQELYSIKRREYDAFTSELLHQIDQQYLIQKQKQQLDVLCKASEFERLEQLHSIGYDEKQDTSPQSTMRIPNERKKQAEIKHLLEETELLKRRESAQKELRLKLEEYKKNLQSGVAKIDEVLKSCDKKHLTTSYSEQINYFIEVVGAFDNIIASKTSLITPETMSMAQSVIHDLEELYRNIEVDVEQAKHKALQESRAALQLKALQESNQAKQKALQDSNQAKQKALQESNQAKLKALQESRTALQLKTLQESNQTKFKALEDSEQVKNGNCVTFQPLEKTATPKTIDQNSPAKEMPQDLKKQREIEVRSSNSDDMEECEMYSEKPEQEIVCIDPEVSREYCSVVQNLKKLEESLKPFKTNPKHKKYRLELHKAVAINTISDASGVQLKAKMLNLISLLSGQSIESSGHYVSCKQDPLAVNYCKNLLAEKIVTQGEEQVRSKVAAAFPFAVVAVVLSAKFPDLWQLILGHFYIRCPYLVPYYPPRESDQSDADYFMSLGYKYTDGKIEETTNFLKRMHGFATLYGAIIQTDPPSGFPAKQSHGIEHGWIWLARMLNMDPRPDVTATLLLAMLDVVGHALAKCYDRQFTKILYVLCKDYFQKIKQITASGGPVGRLKEYLQSAITKGEISPPKGILKSNFWRT